MKKLNSLLLFILITYGNCMAQVIERNVIGSAGITLQNADIEINFTIGELVVSTQNSDTCIVSQGFHQGNLNFNTSIIEAYIDYKIKIFPNPASSNFNISFAENTKGFSVQVFDLLGKLIYIEQVPANQDQTVINSAEYRSGMYLIRLQGYDNQIVYTERITVVN